MANRTLYVADLDGTLLGPGAVMSAFAASTLTRLIDDGALITCATARSWVTVQRVLGSVRFRVPMVLNNGAFTYDSTSSTRLDSHLLHESVARSILERCCRQRLDAVVFSLHGTHEQASWIPTEHNAAMSRYWADRPNDPRAAPRATWADLPTSSVFTVAVSGPSASLANLSEHIRREHADACEVTVQRDANHPEDTWLEVGPARVSKASAIKRLMPLVGATRLVVFGDNLNDLPMFAIADASYAVANAAPAVRDAATAVIESNVNDGVARWLAAELAG